MQRHTYMRKSFLIYEKMRKYFTMYMRRSLVIYDFAPDSLYMRKILYSFLSVGTHPSLAVKSVGGGGGGG